MLRVFSSWMVRLSLVGATFGAAGAAVADVPGLTPGPVEIASLGPMTFADRGVLLVGDPKSASIVAIDTLSEAPASATIGNIQIDDVKAALASAASVKPADVQVGDLAVDVENGQVIVSAFVRGGVGLFRVLGDGDVKAINLDKVAHAVKELPNPPADKIVGNGRRAKNRRLESITDLSFFDGRILVSGLSADEAPSSIREFSFPFADNSVVTNVEIYHAAHGRVEEPAIRTFLPMMVDGKPTLLAGFTCTPLVRFPLGDAASDEKVRGTTIAELGNWNKPIDLISYEKDGQSHLLMSNSARGVMKISTEQIQTAPGLTDKVDNGGTAGQPFEKIEGLDDVSEMDKLNDSHAIVLRGKPDETQSLVVISLP